MSNEARSRLEQWHVGAMSDVNYTAGNQDFANDVVALLNEGYDEGREILKLRAACADFMSVRDQFAGQAMQATINASWFDLEYPLQNGLSIIENGARLAYQIADAMIAERSKP